METMEAGHWPTYTKYQRGKAIPSNRPVYGTRVRCECGWSERVNGRKPEAERRHKWHLRAVA